MRNDYKPKTSLDFSNVTLRKRKPEENETKPKRYSDFSCNYQEIEENETKSTIINNHDKIKRRSTRKTRYSSNFTDFFDEKPEYQIFHIKISPNKNNPDKIKRVESENLKKMEIDDQFNCLKLSEPTKKKRRLSGLHKSTKQNIDVNDSEIMDIADKKENEKILPTRKSNRKTQPPVRWNSSLNEFDNNDNNDSRKNLNSLAAIEKYYLDKTIKRTNTSLETIFEEGLENKKATKGQSMSTRKFKRSINFQVVTSKISIGKIKKRKLKMSKINPKKNKSIKCTLDDLYKKLSSLENVS